MFLTSVRGRASVGCVVISVFAAPLRAATVQALRVDGTMVQGEWMGCPAAASISIRTAEGMERIAFDDLARVIFESPAKPPDGSIVFPRVRK